MEKLLNMIREQGWSGRIVSINHIKELRYAIISRDLFLLYGENCLTYHNESASDFPHWINPSWHHCLTGCMRCQTICPENKAVINRTEDRAEFTEEDTALFIGGVPPDQLPEDMAIKIRDLKINENYRLLSRNLSMILGQ